ncbi:hypothetical protein CURTO8I2_320088 [Curtobacterium sp. 8I-2]|nr:hypothetical protein CURTO8I2_320088 [Curtobacterium sp. 8I-2]
MRGAGSVRCRAARRRGRAGRDRVVRQHVIARVWAIHADRIGDYRLSAGGNDSGDPEAAG